MNLFNFSSRFESPRVSIILTVVFLLMSGQLIFAGDRCLDLFANDPKSNDTPIHWDHHFGTLKKGFTLDPQYKVEIPLQSDIKNQCSLGTCHLYSWVSLLEHNYQSATHEDLKISTHYLAVNHWMRKSLAMLDENSGDDVNIHLGANVFYSRSSILESGIIPDEGWTGPRDFQSDPLSARITEYIKNITARAKVQMNKETDVTKQTKIREKAKNEIRKIFEDLVGKTPATFFYQGKEYTPLSFQTTFFPDLNKQITQIEVSKERKSPTTVTESGTYGTVMSASLDIVEATIRKLLDNGQNVYISYDHNSHFVDNKTGIMAISAFNQPSGGGPVTRAQRSFYKIAAEGHAVQIVGYDFDPKTNKVIKWKIKNSWGVNYGDHGYYHMFNDYFRAFIMSVSFYSDPQFTPPVDEKK